MDVDWKIALTAIALLWSVANSVWTRYLAAQSVTRKEIDKLTDKAQELDHEITRLKERVEQLPSKDFVHRIEKAQVSLEGDMKALNETMRPVARAVTRIEEFLIKEASKK